jgi:hypothetical protein
MHRVALHHECQVNIHITRLECPVRVRPELGYDFGLVEPGIDPIHLFVAKLAIFRWVAFTPGVVWVQTRFCTKCEMVR